MSRPTHSYRFDHPNNIERGLKIMKLLITQFSPVPCHLVPLRPKYSPQRPVLKHTQPTSFLSVSDQVSHPYKTTGKITVLHILIFCPASFRETCHWLKFPLNRLRAQSRVSPVVRLLPLASGPACLGTA